jgi:hypothetical protein
MQHWHALPEARGNKNAPAQQRSSWTSRRHELAAPDLIYADKVKYSPSHPPTPSDMVATYTPLHRGDVIFELVLSAFYVFLPRYGCTGSFRVGPTI